MRFFVRREEVQFHKVNDEIVLQDFQNDKLYRLNHTAAYVWRHCDGETQVEQMLAGLTRELGQEVDEDVIHLALNQFQEAGLLSEKSASPSNLNLSRRKLVRMLSMGAAALLLPVVQQLAFEDATPVAFAGTPCPTTTVTTTSAPTTTGTTTTSAPTTTGEPTTTSAPVTTSPPAPEQFLDQGPSSPPTGSSDPFFIPASTPVPSSAMGLIFNPGDPESIRLGIRNLIAFVGLSDFELRLVVQSGLTLGRQLQRLSAMLLTRPALLVVVDALQRAWLALEPDTRNTLPPIGSMELPQT